MIDPQHLFSSGSSASIHSLSKDSYYSSPSFQSKQLMRHENYSYRKLSNQHFDQALQLLTIEFAAQEPLTNAYYRKYPELKPRQIDSWRKFWIDWLKDSCTNNISVAILDESSNGQLIGVSVAKDLNFEPIGFTEQYVQKQSFMKPLIDLQNQMISQVEPQLRSQLKKMHNVSDIWGVAINQKHMGKKLLGKMIALNEKLSIQQNYKYSFSYATNFKTQKSLRTLGYELIAQTDATKFETEGIFIFSEVDEEQRHPSLWIKPL